MCNGGDSTSLILDEAADPPSVYPMYPALAAACAIPAPDADQWKEAMDWEMENLRPHDVYELVPRTNGVGTLKLG